jgi:ribosomal protein S18 acetylase RimI-like enzyme
MERALAELAGKAFSSASLWVLAKNERACQFYEKNNFRREPGARLVEIGGAELEEVRYVRQLAS